MPAASWSTKLCVENDQGTQQDVALVIVVGGFGWTGMPKASPRPTSTGKSSGLLRQRNKIPNAAGTRPRLPALTAVQAVAQRRNGHWLPECGGAR